MITSRSAAPNTFRDGSLKGTAWKNEFESGKSFYNVTFGRTYVDADGNDSDRFTGSVVQRVKYDPYGTPGFMNASFAAAADTVAWLHLHQGGRRDNLAGLYHFRNRDYDASLGRWINQDPWRHSVARPTPGDGYPDGPNRYESLRSAPTVNVDPSGTYCPHHPKCVALKKKIYGKMNELTKRYKDIVVDKLNLPRWASPGEKPKDSVEGHWEIIRELWRDLHRDIGIYKASCQDPCDCEKKTPNNRRQPRDVPANDDDDRKPREVPVSPIPVPEPQPVPGPPITPPGYREVPWSPPRGGPRLPNLPNPPQLPCCFGCHASPGGPNYGPGGWLGAHNMANAANMANATGPEAWIRITPDE